MDAFDRNEFDKYLNPPWISPGVPSSAAASDAPAEVQPVEVATDLQWFSILVLVWHMHRHATYQISRLLQLLHTSRFQWFHWFSLIFNVLHHASSISFHFHSRRPAAAAGLAALPCFGVRVDPVTLPTRPLAARLSLEPPSISEAPMSRDTQNQLLTLNLANMIQSVVYSVYFVYFTQALGHWARETLVWEWNGLHQDRFNWSNMEREGERFNMRETLNMKNHWSTAFEAFDIRVCRQFDQSPRSSIQFDAIYPGSSAAASARERITV